ncbi:MAG: phosphoribosylamine--glycine ligase, partial [Bacteroidia bacterium]|nr:phosphoribosylamine--glycine ligase [Bacteroidia bacterium]
FKEHNLNFKGFVFFGLIAVNNNPFVIEYNVRMGDPETEVVIPRIEESLSEMLEDAIQGNLKTRVAKTNPDYCTTVVSVSGGYPEAYEKGKEISITDNSETLFHAGTINNNGTLLTSGGRVLAATCFGDSLDSALANSYALTQKLTFEGRNYRTDIGKDLKQFV